MRGRQRPLRYGPIYLVAEADFWTLYLIGNLKIAVSARFLKKRLYNRGMSSSDEIIEYQPGRPKLSCAPDVLASPYIARGLEKTQIAKYHTKGGHGFAAEDANHFSDAIRGKTAEVVGITNDLNGADRMVNGVRIQSKYFQCAVETISAAFDPVSGAYRYEGQLLEVPSDQYEKCVELMRERIVQGKVPGFDNAVEASNIIQKGSISYRQARNIARAGNVDSLVFDAKTQAVTSTGIFAISFVVTFAQTCWQGESPSAAIKTAIVSAMSSGSLSLVTGVLGAQVLKTEAAAIGAVSVRWGVKSVAGTTVGRQVVNRIAVGSLGKGVYGAAAINHVSKLLRSNAITGTIAVAATSTPDFYRALFDRSISWKQFTKNLSVNIGGVAGGTAGWLGGAAVGAALGTSVPIIGTAAGGIAGAILGALSGGFGASVAAKAIADRVADDDSRRLLRMFESELQELASEYMLTESEFEIIVSEASKVATAKWLRQFFKVSKNGADLGAQTGFIRSTFETRLSELSGNRPLIHLPSREDLESEILDLIGKSEQKDFV